MKRIIAIIMTLCMIFGLSSVGVWAADATWQTETPMTTARYGCGASAVGDKIYVMGGTDGSSLYYNTLDIYDTKTGIWTSGQSMPEPKQLFNSVAIGNKIYAIGGLKNGSSITNSMFIYDTVNGSWATGKVMPTYRYDASAAVVGSKIYVMGGHDNTGAVLNTMDIYDTYADVWTAGTPMLTSKYRFTASVKDNLMYIFGGSDLSGNYLNTVEIFNTADSTWTTGASMTSSLNGLTSSIVGDKIYTIGGRSSSAVSTVNIFSTQTNTWENGPSLNVARNLSSSVAVNGKIYVLGGTALATLNSMESLQIIAGPNVPASLTATGGNSKVDLSWGAVTGATTYTVKRSTTAGGPYTVIAENVTGTTYSDTNVTNGTTYYYVVSAVNTAGSSANSNEASATPQAPASAGKALLVITMTNGLEKEYDLSMTEINAFINWYDTKASGNGQGYYTFNKTFNLGPFMTRVDYITFDKIQNFEVMQYQ